MSQKFLESENGVSEIVGEMLLLSITVAIIAIVSVTLYSQMTVAPRAPMVTMDATTMDGSTITLQHGGGDTVSFSELSFIVGATRYTTTSTSVVTNDLNHNGVWEPGETITIPMPSGVTTLDVYDSRVNYLMDKFTIGM
jgi:FlaG/FlaF family flagellin (archaellin)